LRAVVWTLLALGCASDPATPPVLDELELPEGQRFTLHPPVVARGSVVQLELEALRPSLDPATSALAFDTPGLDLQALTVLDGFTATVDLAIADDTPTGPIDATLTVDGETLVLPDALRITDRDASLSPTEGRMGEVVTLTVEGVQTDWSADDTWIRLGADVQTLAVTVESPERAVVRAAIASDARPGWRDVTIERPDDVQTIYDGFLVDRAVITASFDPPVVDQTAEVDVVIEGVNTRFPDDMTADRVQFWRGGTRLGDLTWLSFAQESEGRLTGRVKVSNAARLGFLDVYIEGTDALLLQDAVEVRPTAPDPTDAFLVRRFEVRRELRADGTIDDDVRALAWFVVPLDPPCATGALPAGGPVPFDIPGVFPTPPPGDILDCPEALSLDAGDVVFFESPTNVVALERDISGTGQLLYRGRDLTLADYHFGQTYDIRVPGGPDIPGFLVEDAQPTVPIDYAVSVPFTIDRFTGATVDWTVAGVYPTGFFSLGIASSLSTTGQSAYVGVLPFDDGSYTLPSPQLSQLTAGDAVFTAIAGVEGRVWQLPINNRNHQGQSSLVTRATVVLQ
jgi:hypothetical protein